MLLKLDPEIIRFELTQDLPDYDLVKGDIFTLTENGKTIQCERAGNDTLFRFQITQERPELFKRLPTNPRPT